MTHVQSRVVGHVARIVLERPPANALTINVLEEFRSAIQQLACHAPPTTVRVAIIESGVGGVFSTGADLHERNSGATSAGDFLASLHQAFTTLRRAPFPTIASIGGHALGGGCELALWCDFRLMARGRGRIGLPEVGLGLLPAGGGTQLLCRLTGMARATDLLLRGRLLDADGAAACGLVHSAHDPAALDEAVDAVADDLARQAPLAVAAARRLIDRAALAGMEEGLAAEVSEMLSLDGTHDAREGVAAFVDRRAPRFTGT